MISLNGIASVQLSGRGVEDLIQIPVYPFEREWTHFTSMTYIDEFSELHGKDVPVREVLAGQVPSAGVGTVSAAAPRPHC